MDKNVQEIITIIEEKSEPNTMTRETALEFYEDIIEELKMRCEGLRDEIDTDIHDMAEDEEEDEGEGL